MPLGALDRTPPPFFRQGASALSRLMFFGSLALFLMVADTRFQLTAPLRVAVATVIYPLQWLVLKPVELVRGGAAQVQAMRSAHESVELFREQLRLQAPRVEQFDYLAAENERLRKLLALRERPDTSGMAAQVLYDAADPYSHKVVIDKGLLQGVQLGASVIDESGVLGQVTRVYPSRSEVTLVIDADQATPVVNTRTGVRAIAFGDPNLHGGGLELRYMATDADVQPGDLLTTSGIDGVYPAGFPVARIKRVERSIESPFARIECVPQARVDGAMQVLVLPALADPQADRAQAEPKPEKRSGARGARK